MGTPSTIDSVLASHPAARVRSSAYICFLTLLCLCFSVAVDFIIVAAVVDFDVEDDVAA